VSPHGAASLPQQKVDTPFLVTPGMTHPELQPLFERRTMSNEWTTVGKTRNDRFAGLGGGAGAYQPRKPMTTTVSDPAYEVRQARRREAEEEMYRKEAERKRLQDELTAKKQKEADSLNYASETFYPTLGAPANTTTKAAPAGVWGKKPEVQAPVTPPPKKRMVVETDDAPFAYEDYQDEFLSVAMRRDECMMFRPLMLPSQYRDTSYDEEYETDEIIMNYDSDRESEPMSDSDDDNQEDEFNANTVADRRRGDHGVW
jgi:hypothetical protein